VLRAGVTCFPSKVSVWKLVYQGVFRKGGMEGGRLLNIQKYCFKGDITVSKFTADGIPRGVKGNFRNEQEKVGHAGERGKIPERTGHALGPGAEHRKQWADSGKLEAVRETRGERGST